MKFTIKQLKELIEEAEGDIVSLDDYTDSLYDASCDVIGHGTPYYMLWYYAAFEFRPKLVVELGSWRAYGAAHFACGNPDGYVVTVDIHKDATQVDDHRITKEVAAHYPNLTFIHGWSWDESTVDQIKAIGLPIDVLFIDAWHTYEYAMREWKLYEPLLADQALVVCDDIFDAEGATENMLKFWEEIPGTKANKFINTSMHDGIPMGFLRYVRK